MIEIEEGDNSLGFRTYERPSGEPRLDPPEVDHVPGCPAEVDITAMCACGAIDYEAGKAMADEKTEEQEDKKLWP